MKKYILPKCNSYKANMHCHSTYSDGAQTPEELKEIYKAHGYSVLAITDHEAIFDHGYLDDEDFITIPAYEREINKSAKEWDDVITCHLCIYPKDRNNINNIAFDPDFVHPKFRWMHTPELKSKVTYLGETYKPNYSVEGINHIISEAKKYGFLVTLNHLEWSQERYEQFSQYEGYDALEIYNNGGACGGWDMDDGLYYDALLKLGRKIRCVAADDNHNARHSCGGWIVLRAPALTHSDILGAFERGEYYSSNGPEINELYIEDGKLCIECSDARAIRFVTGNRLMALIKPQEGESSITKAQFPLKNVVDYIRVEVIDCEGKKAYTNAIFKENF